MFRSGGVSRYLLSGRCSAAGGELIGVLFLIGVSVPPRRVHRFLYSNSDWGWRSGQGEFLGVSLLVGGARLGQTLTGFFSFLTCAGLADWRDLPVQYLNFGFDWLTRVLLGFAFDWRPLDRCYRKGSTFSLKLMQMTELLNPKNSVRDVILV